MKLKDFQMASQNEIHEGKRKSYFQEQRRHSKSAASDRFLKSFPGFPLLRKYRRWRRLRLCFQLDFRRLRWGN
jgi:hypothetical protein